MTEHMNKPTVSFQSLDEMGETEYEVLIDDEDRIVQFYLGTISGTEWQSIVRSVPDPLPPVVNFDKKTNRPVHDYEDATYKNAVYAAKDERTYRLLARCLRHIDIPGDTLAQQAEVLKAKLPSRIFFALGTKLLILGSGAEAQVEMRAANFHGNGTGNAKSHGTNGLDADAVERPE